MHFCTSRRASAYAYYKLGYVSQDLSHYKPMGIFPDAQGQLTLQFLVRSSRSSSSSEMLWMFPLPASTYEEDPIKN